MRNITVSVVLILLTIISGSCSSSNYKNSVFYETQRYNGKNAVGIKPKNIILLIGDGMGVAQLFAGMTANKGHLNIESFPYVGLSRTYSANSYVTDSAAGGTAMSTGRKTNNGFLAVDPEGKSVTTILERAEVNGLSTGLVSTSSITHATPASFIAHVADRGNDEEIAEYFLKTDIDIFIGGGRDYFTARKDKRNLTDELIKKGYTVVNSYQDAGKLASGKVVALTAPGHNPSYTNGRGDMLPDSTSTAVRLLAQNHKGFFVMIEGSQIDWGCHANDISWAVNEMLDFDRAVGRALAFAAKDGNTLVIVTADHETGGLTLPDGDIAKGEVKASFSCMVHTGVMVPVFAFGPGAENFAGIYENTSIFDKMVSALGLK